MNDQKSNPNAAQIRLGPASPSKTAGQRKHDLRIGKQPEYVDEKRSPKNRILIEPKTADEMKKRAVERRDRKPRKRAMKSNAAVSFSGIITFGHLAHLRFERLTANQQDAAFLELAQSIADRHGADLTGLVVHVDEAGLHAHFQMDAYDENGDALSDKVKRADLRALQDLTAEVMAKHCPGIERGQGKVERLKAGASPAEVVYKKPAEMRRALAQDLEAAKTQKTDLEAERDKLAARIAKLEAFGDDLTKKGKEQLETAQRRLQTKENEIAAVEQKLAAAQKLSAETQKRATEAHTARLGPLLASIAALDAYESEKRAIEQARQRQEQQTKDDQVAFELAEAFFNLTPDDGFNVGPRTAKIIVALAAFATIDENPKAVRGGLSAGGFREENYTPLLQNPPAIIPRLRSTSDPEATANAIFKRISYPAEHGGGGEQWSETFNAVTSIADGFKYGRSLKDAFARMNIKAQEIAQRVTAKLMGWPDVWKPYAPPPPEAALALDLPEPVREVIRTASPPPQTPKPEPAPQQTYRSPDWDEPRR